MRFIQTDIPDVIIVEPVVFEDDRGWFMESFNEPRFHQGLKDLGLSIPPPFVQDNHSCSKKNVLRGLHYQLPPHAQGKLVRIIKGAAYDVAVDIRKGSPTFGQSVGVELTAGNKRMLWIPEGFAHGFLTLEDDTHFLYKTTDIYSKKCEEAIRWNDPDLNIHWPVSSAPVLNEKDQIAPSLSEQNKIFSFKKPSVSKLVDLKIIGDVRGSLIALEKNSNLPFNLQRVYYIFDTKSGVSRGFHAHRKLQQLAVCVSGKCRMILDDGKKREDVWLDSPAKGLLISNMVWREMHDFSEDCVLVVLANEPYSESDYIRDYNEFLKEAMNE
ncbi:dTDP-4-dehydrorhamnose 3,5-epimerase [Legionella israelensis]|uniref:dTDP-4-dehydrorhamnose 3,5-epimerase n=1 Tax=Legionella israelensis TaxID=454 RepID=A0AAX1EI84_9GAMM|nr:dTDP-4-dehydrorhamnose 3,5-epimerase [Legionella israelensis]QBR84537.1 dTDP-4-dehydrorhamnose 3,5-epimerase [Legionella israelensis]